jgi:endogenous inhibitor of DNA gyrase (YacG/DUF329 family)|tara:strand:- start:13 stop:210 length:198 start_codon:yes stop_codon:yes gene_type:complete
MTTNTKHVNCPSCQKEVTWTEKNQYRPFCSERCKLIDFGDWATEKNAIAGNQVFNDEDEIPDQLQ